MLALVFLALAGVACAVPKVKLGRTTLTGTDIPGLRLEFFGGIPYASPPLGALRFEPPVLKTKLDNATFDARSFGLACPQLGLSTNLISENCLTINVFRPAGTSPEDKLPVLFWTYGGSFERGASSVYNASALVAQSVLRGTPVIYVSFNYRVGPLGFAQGQEAEDAGSVNLGLRDQIAALEWVQKNICVFGGDRKKVTAFGESAGAIMTSILFLDSTITGLARAAILQSGSAASSVTLPASGRERVWQTFVAGVPECTSLATSGNTLGCLKKKASLESILQGFRAVDQSVVETTPWSPVIDGKRGVYRDYPSRLFKKGQFSRIPFITGTNLDEGTLFTPRDPSIPFSEDMIRGFLLATFSQPTVDPDFLKAKVELILDLYPDDPALGSPFNTGNETFGLAPGYKRFAAIQGDLAFQATRRMWIQAATKQGTKAYGYLFTQPQPNAGALGVAHAVEIPYVYGVPPSGADSDITLSRIMMDYWISFAVSLNPNDRRGLKRPLWDQYTPSKQVLIQLEGTNTRLIPDTYRADPISAINADPLVFLHRREF